jgi:ERCC4-type nuclease
MSGDPWGLTPDLPTVLVDTREQRPLRFSSAVLVERCTLPTGDYSIVGYTDRIVIERKAPEDLWQCCGRGRERFESELARLRDYAIRAVVVEATIDQILATPPAGRIQPATVIRSTISWQQDFAVPFVWAGNPRNAAAWVEYSLLRLPRKEAERKAAA